MALVFDPNKSFDAHVAEFRAHLEAIDPQCAKILFDNLAVLLGDGSAPPTRANRTVFNDEVIKALEDLRTNAAS